jgi:hypothetical protein
MGRIYKDIGFIGLWNGLPVRIVMIGTVRIFIVTFMTLPFQAVVVRHRPRGPQHASHLLNHVEIFPVKTC